MSKIFVFSIFLFSITTKPFYGCSHNFKPDEVTGIELTYHLPYVDNNGDVVDTHSKYDVYYLKDLVMYRFEYRFDSSINGERVLTETRNRFFVFQKDSVYGYMYYPDNTHTMQTGRMATDSILETYTFKNSKFDTLLNYKPESSNRNAEGDLVKLYEPPVSSNFPEKFSLYFYYSTKMNGIKESLSKSMDNTNELKLFKIKILAHGYYYKEYKMNFPERETIYEMKEINPENKEQIMNYFKMYKN